MIFFYLMFTVSCRQADFVASASFLVSLTLVINYCKGHCYRRLIIAGLIVTDKKLIAGVMESITKTTTTVIKNMHKGAIFFPNFHKHLEWPNKILKGHVET
jgi:hypothetical protein